MNSKRRNFRITFAVSVVLLTAIAFFLISVLDNLPGARIDMTSNKLFTMSPAAAKILKDNATIRVEIQGHTDSIGSEKVNLELGYKRAHHVLRYLNMEHGFPLHRMNVISYGEMKPIADNGTKEGRAQNRRVTLVVMN